MAQNCPACLTPVEPNARFCPECGTNLPHLAGTDGPGAAEARPDSFDEMQTLGGPSDAGRVDSLPDRALREPGPGLDSLDDLQTAGGLPEMDRCEVLPGRVQLELVWVQPGEFLMGSGPAEGREDEWPARRVRITRGFYLGIFPITQEQYRSLMGADPSRFPASPRHPVENVSWDDAREFCRRLQEHLLRAATVSRQPRIGSVALPTEAQWEYACRAGTIAAYSFGNDRAALVHHGWFARNAERTTHPVGLLKPNLWGLYDLYGNIWEWCQDYYAPSYAALGSEDPQGPAAGDRRVLRGGSWNCLATECRSASRRSAAPQERTANYGFRVAMYLE